jgi:5'-nucleotidase (lipoprotein e(P4) family)
VLFLGCKTQDLHNETVKPELQHYNVPVREHAIQALLWQQQSAEYRALSYQAFYLARLQLDNLLATKNKTDKPIAIVTDIDETVMDNSPYSGYLINANEEYTPATWAAWVSKKSAEAVPGALEFFNYAASKDVAIFYVSNRNVQLQKETMDNLKSLGFPSVTEKHVLLKSTTSGKEPRRDEVSKTHQIELLLGDNLSDFSTVFENQSTQERNSAAERLQAEFGKKFIVLPNPMYGDWETKGIYESNYNWTTFQKDSIRRKKIKAY